jgi:nitroimidazol reductase NimA-like FMN-containing flavoprotein (pyridoxamine 5'-phosphate oxidase superfamily)
MTVEELEGVGIERMTDREIGEFLTSRGVGVLGLPAEDGPYLVPMSFGFDGDAALYFTFLVGASSRKADLADRADLARFLVYDARSAFTWQSVVLTGEIDEVPPAEFEAVAETMHNAWRPALFEDADLTRGVSVYRFEVADRVGFKHTGLPPGFASERAGAGSDDH